MNTADAIIPLARPTELESASLDVALQERRFTISYAQQYSKLLGEDVGRIYEHRSGVVLVIADGAHKQGDARAAALAVAESVGKVVQDYSGSILDYDWATYLKFLDNDIGSRIGGETTAIIVASDGQRFSGASCGDSRLGLMTLGEGIYFPTRFQEKKRIGTGSAKPVEFRGQLQCDFLILGTDGLWDRVPELTVPSYLEVHRHSADARALVELARDGAGLVADDTTVIMFRRAEVTQTNFSSNSE